jgi:OPA family glycerol-3-phosphate transporter-like MFS transporter
MGLTYAFLYMGRYNLTVSKNALGDLMTKEDFGLIFGAGTVVYALAFLLNGPLTDRFGGRRALLVAATGAGVMNLLLGLYLASAIASGTSGDTLRLVFALLYGGNMYFQSFGAVAIVKVNAHWFHVRERGGFSGIFGTMISSGIFFAFSVNGWILDLFTHGLSGTEKILQTKWVFFLPGALLLAMAVLEFFLLRDRPGEAGHQDFDTGDASSGDTQDVSSLALMKRVLTHPIILTVALIEFCTGVLRNGVMHWYPIYVKEVLALPGEHYLNYGAWGSWLTIVPFFLGAAVFFALGARFQAYRGRLVSLGGLLFLFPFLQAGWGGILMVAGVVGGNVAGFVSDLFFGSRRAPAAGGLYAALFLCTIAMGFSLGRSTNTLAASKLPELKAGDRIVAVAGKPVTDWVSARRAFACAPAACAGGAGWDEARCACSSQRPASPAAALAQPPVIALRVERGGQEVAVDVKDPAYKAHKDGSFTPVMRAGDIRELKASPSLSLSPYILGVVVFLISLCVIGTHGLLSGTATMDFGGKKGAATAVAMIDGFVYLGTALQSFALGKITSHDWAYWPWFLAPFALIGFLLSLRIWNARPSGASAH